MSLNPTYFGAIINTKDGDARIMCMVQESEESGRSIHYLKVDTSLDDVGYSFPAGGERSLQEELRGTGLAVRRDPSGRRGIEKMIEDDLRSAYGRSASIKLKSIDKPTLVSLFI